MNEQTLRGVSKKEGVFNGDPGEIPVATRGGIHDGAYEGVFKEAPRGIPEETFGDISQ